MGDTERSGEDIDRDHLERSRQVWDRRRKRYGHSERDLAPLFDDAVERLGLDRGDAVLEIGCGPGTNLARLRERVGPEGRIVAVDYSPEMVAGARERVAERGWDNVTVRRADATRVDLDPAAFDAALASLSMSVMPDATAATRRVREALVPGGRFVVFDVRPVPSGPLRAVNPLLVAFYRWYANWNPETDVVDALTGTFDEVTVEETYFAGAGYRAVATAAGTQGQQSV